MLIIDKEKEFELRANKGIYIERKRNEEHVTMTIKTPYPIFNVNTIEIESSRHVMTSSIISNEGRYKEITVICKIGMNNFCDVDCILQLENEYKHSIDYIIYTIDSIEAFEEYRLVEEVYPGTKETKIKVNFGCKDGSNSFTIQNDIIIDEKEGINIRIENGKHVFINDLKYDIELKDVNDLKSSAHLLFNNHIK